MVWPHKCKRACPCDSKGFWAGFVYVSLIPSCRSSTFPLPSPKSVGFLPLAWRTFERTWDLGVSLSQCPIIITVYMLTNENMPVSWLHGPRAWPVTYEKSLTVIPYDQMPSLQRNFNNVEIPKCSSEGRTAHLQVNTSNIGIADNAMHMSRVKRGAEGCCKSRTLSYTSTSCLFHHCFVLVFLKYL